MNWHGCQFIGVTLLERSPDFAGRFTKESDTFTRALVINGQTVIITI